MVSYDSNSFLAGRHPNIVWIEILHTARLKGSNYFLISRRSTQRQELQRTPTILAKDCTSIEEDKNFFP